MDTKFIKQKGPNDFVVNVKLVSKVDKSIVVQRSKLKGLKTIKEAIKVRDNLKEVALREVIKREQLGSLWGTLVTDWMTGVQTGTIQTKRDLGQNTLYDYFQSANKYTKCWWRKPAAEINSIDVKQLFYKIANDFNRSRAIQMKVKCIINAVFDWGIATGKIRGVVQSPATNIKLASKKVQKQPEILTQTQIAKFLNLARQYNHPWFPIWLAAIHTGARNGELYALEWSDVDLDQKRIFINKSFNKRRKIIGWPKGKDWREIPINDELLSFLKKQKLKNADSKYVLPRLTDWDRSAQAKVLKTFLFQIGLPPIKFHTLRACFATHLLRNGVSVATVMKLGGWKDMSTVQVYLRLAGIEVQGATDSLSYMSAEDAVSKVVHLFKRDD